MRARSHRGFTLAELVVGGIVIALIAASVTVALSQALDAERRARARQEAVRRANAAADVVARDLRAIARQGELFYTHLRVDQGNIGSDSADELLLVATSSRSTPAIVDARGNRRPSGATYEAQYRLVRDPRRDGVPGGDEPALVLLRRVDDLPDIYDDAGGVVYPIVSGVRSFDVRVHDGRDWTDGWDTDSLGYPYAVRVEVEAVSDDGSVTERAVRVVPIDRVPLPFTPVFTQGEGGA